MRKNDIWVGWCFLGLFLLSIFCFAVTPAGAEDLPSWSVSSQILKRSGEPFFPIGIYYVAHYPVAQRRRLRDLPQLVAAGLNTVYTPITLSDRPFLDSCAAANISVLAEFNDDSSALIRKFGDHPALMGWASFDDVDAEKLGLTRHQPVEVKKRTIELHRQTPRLLTYISGGYPQRLGRYAGLADLVGLQVYPIPDEPLSTVAQSYLGPLQDQLSAAGQVTLANVQLFGWDGIKRYPTPAELRNMTFQALIGGVRGILYYTFYDPVTDLTTQPALWEEVRYEVKKLQKVRRFLAAGQRCLLQSNSPAVLAAIWTLTGKSLLVVVNTANKVQTVELQGCGRDTQRQWRMVLGVKEGMTVLQTKSALRLQLEPQGVLLLKAETK